MRNYTSPISRFAGAVVRPAVLQFGGGGGGSSGYVAPAAPPPPARPPAPPRPESATASARTLLTALQPKKPVSSTILTGKEPGRAAELQRSRTILGTPLT